MYDFCRRTRVTTYQRDQESGLDYAMNRYYGNTTGRFNSPDKGPIILYLPRTLNRYSYVHSDPINYLDPSGLHGTCYPDDPGPQPCDPPPLSPDPDTPREEPDPHAPEPLPQGGGPLDDPEIGHGFQMVRNALTADSNCDNWFRTAFANSQYSAGSTFEQFLTNMRALTGTTQLAAGTNAVYDNQVPGLLIRINITGAYFQAVPAGSTIAPSDNNREYFNTMNGNSNRARGFILLHELAHVLNMISPNDNGTTGVQGANQRANNDAIYEHCNQGLNTLSNTAP